MDLPICVVQSSLATALALVPAADVDQGAVGSAKGAVPVELLTLPFAFVDLAVGEVTNAILNLVILEGTFPAHSIFKLDGAVPVSLPMAQLPLVVVRDDLSLGAGRR